MEILFVVGLTAVGILLTWIIDKFSKKRIIKYIAAFIPLIITIVFFYDAKFIPEGMEDLAEVLGGIIFGTIFVSMIITSLILDFVKKKG